MRTDDEGDMDTADAGHWHLHLFMVVPAAWNRIYHSTFFSTYSIVYILARYTPVSGLSRARELQFPGSFNWNLRASELEVRTSGLSGCL